MRHSSHRIKASLLATLTGLACISSSAFAKPGPAHSVVKITCRVGDKEWLGTGFAWEKGTEVVTALHVVAGCQSIEVYSEGLKKTTTASTRSALVQSDLALLELAESIGLEPLGVTDQVLPDKPHTIWGYPLEVRTMQGDELRFSRVLKPNSTLEDVMSEKKYRETLGAAGYPGLKAAILRVGSTIQPGHSGAPIFTPDGHVVGIGDGGLYEGIKSINWAIPTASLKTLPQSKDAIPNQRPRQASHFSVASGNGNSSSALGSGTGSASAAPASIAFQEGGQLRFMFSAQVKEILTTASSEEKKYLGQLLGDKHESDKGDDDEESPDEDEAVSSDEDSFHLLEKVLDVYEDPITGATIALPHGMKPRFDAKSGMVTAANAGGLVNLFIHVSVQNARQANQHFESFCKNGQEWQRDPEFEEYRVEEEDMIEVEKSLFIGKGPDDPTQTMYYSAMADLLDDTFLGTAVIAKDWKRILEADIVQLALLKICVELSGFRLD